MFPMSYSIDKPDWLHPRACRVCRKIKCICDPEQRSRAATCSICTLAPIMRHCDECQFWQLIPIVLSVEVSLDTMVAHSTEL